MIQRKSWTANEAKIWLQQRYVTKSDTHERILGDTVFLF